MTEEIRMSVKPLLSVIIPAFNTEKYLGRCIDSVLEQTYRNLQVIVVDDGSADATGRIADEYALRDKRVKVIHQKNQGVSSARNLGIMESSGEYIGFADSDDELEKDMYELLISNATRYSTDISHCGYKMIFPNRVDEYHGTGAFLLQNREEGVRDLLNGRLIEPGLCNKIYRRELFEGINYDFTIQELEDLLLNSILFSKSSLSVFKDDTKYHYMIRKESATTSDFTLRKLNDIIKVAESVVTNYRGNIQLEKYALAKRLNLYISLYTQAALSKQNEIHDREPDLRCRINEYRLDMKHISVKYRLFANGIIYCPTVYLLIKRIHARITGSNQRYIVSSE